MQSQPKRGHSSYEVAHFFFVVTISRDSLCSQKISREIAKLQNQSAIPKTILPNGPGFSKLPSMVRQTALFVAMLQ